MRKRAYLVALALALGAAGCGRDVGTQRQSLPPPSSAITTLRTPSRVSWGIVGGAPPSLDPAVATDSASVDVAEVENLGLVRLTPHLRVVPAAAARWTVTQGGDRYRFFLRAGLRFSDGAPLTASDVVASFKRAIGPEGSNGIMPSYLPEIKRTAGAPAIYTYGPHEVDFTLSHPSSQFLAKLTFPGASIVDMATISRYGQLWTSHIDTLGPFSPSSSSPDGDIRLSQNPYLRPRPVVTHLDLSFGSPAWAIRGFALGRLDVVSGLTASRSLLRRFGPEAHTAIASALDYLVVNTRRAPLDSQFVRRALALSIDRPVLVRQIFGSSAIAAGSCVPEPLLAGTFQQTYDPGVAVGDLRQAQHPFSRGLRHLVLIFPDSPLERQRASILEGEWLRVLGWRILGRGLPSAAYERSVRRGEFDLALVRWGAQYPDAANFLEDQLATHAPDNFGGWSNGHFDKLIAVARRAGINSMVRRQALIAADDLASRQAAWIPLDSPIEAALISPRLAGLTLTSEGIMGWPTVGLGRGESSG